jgi:two-component system KDP operon response regulator KdpE
MGAIEFLGKLRDWSRTPVMILSESDAEAAKVAALDAGADDFLLKPFGESEIRARLRALLRRFPGLPNERFFVQGELMVDLTSRQVTVRGEIVDLTATERSLLLELVRHAGKVVPHEQLLVSVWGPNSLGQPQVLREYINHLRKKLNPAGGGPAIETTYGAGYRLAVKGVGDDY